MTGLIALAERIEGLSGPDRETDALIRCAVHQPWEWNARPARSPGMVTVNYESGSHGTFISPRFTASVDDAMSLIPEGWTWAVDATAPELGIDWTLHGPGLDGPLVTGTAATPALALCAAALRARDGMEMGS